MEGLESGDLDEVVSSVHFRKDVEIISFQLTRGSSDKSSRGQSSTFGNRHLAVKSPPVRRL